MVADGVLWVSARDTFGELPTAYWLMGVLAVVVDARPYVVANRRASSVILPSICFTFAIALAWGFVPALAVQLIAVAVAGVRLRHPAKRTLHLAVQHAVALGAAAVVAAASSSWGTRARPSTPRPVTSVEPVCHSTSHPSSSGTSFSTSARKP